MNLCFSTTGLMTTQVGVLRVLLLASVAIVFVNTITFFVRFDEEVGRVTSSHALLLAKISKGVVAISLFVAGGWGVYVLWWPVPVNTPMNAEGQESVSLVLFGLFIIIDVLAFAATRAETAAGNSSIDLGTTSGFLLDSLFLVDVPVVCGVAAILWLTLYLHRISITAPAAISDEFLAGITVGAIAMHIAFSQFVFCIVRTRAIKKAA
jgi:hypothetical protein